MTRPHGSEYLCPEEAREDQFVRYHLDRKAMGYLYAQMVDHLTDRIASGDLAVNDRLPAELELAREYGVSLGTARRATDVLRERGLVATLPSKGTFVLARPTESTDDEPEPGWLALVHDLAR